MSAGSWSVQSPDQMCPQIIGVFFPSCYHSQSWLLLQVVGVTMPFSEPGGSGLEL